MSETNALSITPTQPKSGALSAPERRRRWFELALVLLVAFGGAIFGAIYSFASGATTISGLSIGAREAYDLIREATVLLLLAYVLSRRHLGFKSLGLRWSMRDVLIGVLLVAASYGAYRFGVQAVRYVDLMIFLSQPTYRPASAFFGHPGWFGVAFALFNPFFEELIVRAYLMTEIIELTGSASVAVISSVALQSIYHLYYGWAGVLVLACQFLVFSLYFARWRRALPIVVAHGFFDVYAVIRLMY